MSLVGSFRAMSTRFNLTERAVELIPQVEHVVDAHQIHQAGLNEPFVRIRFDFAFTKQPLQR